MATSKKQTNTSFENLRLDPFLSNSILLDDQIDPDINSFNRNNMKSIDTQYFLQTEAKNVVKHIEHDSFSTLHINIRSLSKNLENFKTQKRGRKKISYHHYFIYQVIQLFIKKKWQNQGRRRLCIYS